MSTLSIQKKQEFQDNHMTFIEVYTEYLDKNGKPPTVTELSRLTGFSRPTIYNHLNAIQISDVGARIKQNVLPIINALIKKANDGNVEAIKLALNIGLGWSEKKVVDVNQTNKTLQITFVNPNKEQMKKIADGNIEDAAYKETEE